MLDEVQCPRLLATIMLLPGSSHTTMPSRGATPLETSLRKGLSDDDLLAVARERQVTGVLFAGLIYRHQLAATVGKYVLDLEVVCQVLDPEEMANRIEFLPLGK